MKKRLIKKGAAGLSQLVIFRINLFYFLFGHNICDVIEINMNIRFRFIVEDDHFIVTINFCDCSYSRSKESIVPSGDF